MYKGKQTQPVQPKSTTHLKTMALSEDWSLSGRIDIHVLVSDSEGMLTGLLKPGYRVQREAHRRRGKRQSQSQSTKRLEGQSVLDLADSDGQEPVSLRVQGEGHRRRGKRQSQSQSTKRLEGQSVLDLADSDGQEPHTISLF